MLATTQRETANLTTEIVNPIIQAARDVFDMMLGCKVARRNLALQSRETPFHDVTAVIGLSGGCVGSICLSFPKETVFGIVQTLLDHEVDHIDSVVCDAVGEFTNMVAGSAKEKLTELQLNMGLPNIVHGSDHHVDFPSQSQPLVVHFDSDFGPFMVVFGFIRR